MRSAAQLSSAQLSSAHNNGLLKPRNGKEWELTAQARPRSVKPCRAPGHPKASTSCGVASIPKTIPPLKLAWISVSALALYSSDTHLSQVCYLRRDQDRRSGSAARDAASQLRLAKEGTPVPVLNTLCCEGMPPSQHHKGIPCLYTPALPKPWLKPCPIAAGNAATGAYFAAMADVAGMMHDCASPCAARAASRAGNLCCGGRLLIRLVMPVTSVHSSRLLCITGMPPILSAKTPSGICEAQQQSMRH